MHEELPSEYAGRRSPLRYSRAVLDDRPNRSLHRRHRDGGCKQTCHWGRRSKPKTCRSRNRATQESRFGGAGRSFGKRLRGAERKLQQMDSDRSPVCRREVRDESRWTLERTALGEAVVNVAGGSTTCPKVAGTSRRNPRRG